MNSSARLSAAVGVAAWLGALTGWAFHGSGSASIAMGGVAAVLGLRRHRVTPSAMLVAGVAVAASLSGALGASRHDATLGAELRDGQVHFVGIAADEPIQSFGTTWVVVKSGELVDGVGDLPPLAVSWAAEETPRPGDVVAARGRLVGQPGTVRGDPTAGRVYSRDVRIVRRAGGVFHSAANVMRSRVGAVLDAPGSGQADALLAGFLIGDTSNLESSRIDELRKAGLSHFVAVSGSNVALFLAAWWLVLTPLAGPRVRAVTGLVGLVLFVVVTRWEPSVLRAATMLGLILAGRLASIPIDPVVALGWGVAALLLVSGDLAVSVGFQLSLAATVGVMVGTRAVAARRPRWVWAILGATGGAQVAVAPLVLLHFETVPLMAPVANLVAAPLVTLATSLGGLAVLVGGGFVLSWARGAASAVLWVADRAGTWPQLDLAAFGVVTASLSMLWIRRLRPVVAAALIASVLVGSVPGTAHPGATLTALDIGQGDAILLRDGESVMLIDGGPHPQELADALARHRVESIEVVVVTHGDADHAAGLVGVLDRFDVAELWVPAYGLPGAFIEGLVAEAEVTGAKVVPVAAGAATHVGRIRVSVLGPSRRFKSDNDGAIVLWVDAGSTSVLLPSDAEAVAQGELPPLRPDVMLVPHHGSATTDDHWLEATTGALSIISVGENRYGHPDPGILDVLAATGTEIRSTQEVGDVVVPLLDP